MGEEDWEIEERSSYNYYSEESKVAWILDNGMSIVKKIVITGVVISSAPLVLPLLVFISTVGFALSVPCGILLCSYACTEKLMSKLLPRPDYPLMLEGGTIKNKNGYRDYLEEKRDEREKESEEGCYEEDVGEYLDISGNEEKPSTEKEKEEESTTDYVGVSKDDEIHMENKDAEKGESAENKDEKDNIGGTEVGDKTITNGNRKSKKLAEKRLKIKEEQQEELNKKATNAAAREIADKSNEDSAKLHSSAEAPESKQTTANPTSGSRTEPRKDMGKA